MLSLIEVDMDTTDPFSDTLHETGKIPEHIDTNFYCNGVLTVAMLEEAYQTITYGYIEPEVLEGSPETIDKVKKLMLNLMLANKQDMSKLDFNSLFYYNNAKLLKSNRLSEGVLEFVAKHGDWTVRLHI